MGVVPTWPRERQSETVRKETMGAEMGTNLRVFEGPVPVSRVRHAARKGNRCGPKIGDWLRVFEVPVPVFRPRTATVNGSSRRIAAKPTVGR